MRNYIRNAGTALVLCLAVFATFTGPAEAAEIPRRFCFSATARTVPDVIMMYESQALIELYGFYDIEVQHYDTELDAPVRAQLPAPGTVQNVCDKVIIQTAETWI